MTIVDISSNSRIPVLLGMVNRLSRLADPCEAVELLVGGIRRAYGPRSLVMVSMRGLHHGQYRITRLLTSDDRDLAEPAVPWDPEAVPVRDGGVIGQIIHSLTPKLIHEVDLSDDPALGASLGDCHSLIAVPIFTEGAPGDWVVLLDPRPQGLSIADLEEMILRANLVGAATSNLLIAQQLFSANFRIQHEMEQIAEIQRSLLPEAVPQVLGLTIAASYETFDQAGGDMYDFVALGDRPQAAKLAEDRRWAILIGDVSGHGPSAAVVMAMFHAILHTYPHRPNGPGELLEHINRHLCATPIGHSFVTAFLGLYDPSTRDFTYARAGHNPPILRDVSGATFDLDAVGSIPLGIDADTTYEQTTVRLTRGQSLILYTDGITESADESGEFFGPEGIIRAAADCADPQEMVRNITYAVDRHLNGKRPKDDQTIVAVRVE